MREERSVGFKKNDNLESFLEDLNNNLSIAEAPLLTVKQPEFPLIFVVGPLRSGTTLLTQWLANSGLVSYPTNLMSRFYKAPIIGAKIQRVLTDPSFNFRNEILDFNGSLEFSSENGKTVGALSPNEFWFFWRRFLPSEKLHLIDNESLKASADIDSMLAEFSGIVNVLEKPFALKAMILNFHIKFLSDCFEKAIFIHTVRNPLSNVESALDARKRQLGDESKWYSFKVPQYEQLAKLSPEEQVAGQIFFTHEAIKHAFSELESNKKITVNYEEFCHNPKKTYEELILKLKSQGYICEDIYYGEDSFNVSRSLSIDRSIIDACKKFFS